MPRLSAFVINLAERIERLRGFDERARLARLAYERIEAIDTRDLGRLEARASAVEPSALASLLASARRGYRSRHSELTPGAVGCALSHVAASRLALERGLHRRDRRR